MTAREIRYWAGFPLSVYSIYDTVHVKTYTVYLPTDQALVLLGLHPSAVSRCSRTAT